MPELIAPEGDRLAGVAAVLCPTLRCGDVVYLEGVIGAGKTTLVQACALALGVREPVTSPTFSLAHRYAGTPPVTHLDLYRLEQQPLRDPGELLDYLGDDVIAFVEWPGVGQSWLPPASACVRIGLGAQGERLIAVTLPSR